MDLLTSKLRKIRMRKVSPTGLHEQLLYKVVNQNQRTSLSGTLRDTDLKRRQNRNPIYSHHPASRTRAYRYIVSHIVLEAMFMRIRTIMMQAATGIVIGGSLALVGSFSGMEITSFAQPAPPLGKTIPPGMVRTKPEVVEGEVLVRYKDEHIRAADPSDRANRADRIRRLGKVLQDKFPMTVISTHPDLGIQRLKLPPRASVKSAIQSLKNFPEVEYAEPNYKIYPLFSTPPADKFWQLGPLSLWGMKRIGMDQTLTASVAVTDNYCRGPRHRHRF